ncbi:ATP-dependent 6-phosphofructokinase [Algivirga pacifica]|uniref:ATP-dependent 6-phosphofructokinase n=1 Tax=Algivirga pacifica TaxID=1162670 RepID=A0ABP9D5H6_9BACT
MNIDQFSAEDFHVQTLGDCAITTPLVHTYDTPDYSHDFAKDDQRVLFDASVEGFRKAVESGEEPISFEVAGPREKIYFTPANTKAAIVTCGGLCPGLNNVIRSIVMGLYYRYGVQNIVGIPYGYQGLNPAYNHKFINLDPEVVKDIHLFGGSILGSSRGQQDIGVMVDTLVRNNVNMLFTIGGDGTLSGAHAIAEEIKRRNLKIAVAGVPKTIDNDVNFIQKTFGFETAFTTAAPILRDAHNEATGAYNGVAIVKLMGRDSGFIAANAAMAMPDVNFVLVPENPFELEGPHGFLPELKKRVQEKKHALVVVAEGAGQNLFENLSEEEVKKDASGNIRYKDIGLFLKDKITEYLTKEGMDPTVKYIDPSYIIRSKAANASDSIFCSKLALNAVHGVMAGKTDFVVGRWHHSFTYLPIPVCTKTRKKININGDLWWSVLETTGQPPMMK